jgi:hypothetical protein
MGFKWSYWGLGRAEAAGIEPYEALDALQGSWPRPIRVNGMPFLTFWGRTRSGRGLIIATRRDGPWDWQIVDLRQMTADEGSEYDKWKDQRDE